MEILLESYHGGFISRLRQEAQMGTSVLGTVASRTAIAGLGISIRGGGHHVMRAVIHRFLHNGRFLLAGGHQAGRGQRSKRLRDKQGCEQGCCEFSRHRHVDTMFPLRCSRRQLPEYYTFH